MTKLKAAQDNCRMQSKNNNAIYNHKIFFPLNNWPPYAVAGMDQLQEKLLQYIYNKAFGLQSDANHRRTLATIFLKKLLSIKF